MADGAEKSSPARRPPADWRHETMQLPSFYSPRTKPLDKPAGEGQAGGQPVDELTLPGAASHQHHPSSSSASGHAPSSFVAGDPATQLPPPSLLSPAFTPPATPGISTPTRETAPPRGIPVDSSIPSGGCGTKRPRLLETLPEVRCTVRARIPTVTGTEMFLHLYTNNIDNKEHLAIVFGDNIRSQSLDAVWPGETEWDRMVRGAYTGTLYPGRTTSGMTGGRTGGEVDRESEVDGDGDGDRRRATQNTDLDNSVAAPASTLTSASALVPASISTSASASAPLVRIHSECYTGETAWSARCDCGEQLDEAARLMSLPGSSAAGGIIIYLRQEGRGIGLGEKLKAYNLQDLGSDTVQANLLLRHPADARSYGLATAMLLDLGQREVRLLTNNPDKIRAVEGPNREIVVRERVAMVPLSWKGQGGFRSREVEGYLKTKIEKMGHMLEMDSLP